MLKSDNLLVLVDFKMLRFNPLSRIYTSFSPLGRRYGALSLRRPFPKSNITFASFKKQLSTSVPPPAGKKPTGIKALVKEYGYSALAIYFALSMIDLPIIYVLVHASGKEKIEIYENKVKQFFGYGVSDEELAKKQEIDRIQESIESSSEETDVLKGSQGIIGYVISQFSWTEFAIAYGIHKSLIFIRLPITAAITPGIVKILRRWGFKIGTAPLSTTASLAKDTIKTGITDVTASSTKFGVRGNTKRKWFWFF